MGLLGRYNHAPNPRLQSPVGCSGSQNTAGRQAIWGRRIGLCLCSSHCHPARQCLKKAHFFFGRFCGVKNASERRTFCCAVHQKRDFKAHPTASTALLVGSFQLAADSRLSTFDSQLFHSRPRLPLDSRNLRSGYRSCGQRGLEFDCGLEKGLFDGRNHPMSLHRL